MCASALCIHNSCLWQTVDLHMHEYCWLEYAWATWKTTLLAYISLSTGWSLTILWQNLTVCSESVGQLAPRQEMLLPRAIALNCMVNVIGSGLHY